MDVVPLPHPVRHAGRQDEAVLQGDGSIYGEPMPAAQFAMESRRDLKTLRANKQALLDAWEELGQQA